MKTTKLSNNYLLKRFTLTLLCGGLVACVPKEVLILKEQEITKELGEAVSTDAEEYLVEETSKEILDKTVLSSSVMEDEAYVVNDEEKVIVSAEKDFLAVGVYVFTITYDESESKEVKVVVKDTTAPTFSEDFLKEIKVEQNAKDVDFNAFYKCEDLSVCKVEADGTSVDLSKTGEYTMKVSATDEYENKTEEEVKVIVVSMEEARKENGVTKTLEGKVFKSEALVKKLEEEKKAAEAKKKAEEEAKKNNSSGNNNSNKKPNGGSNNNSGSSSNSGSNNSGNSGSSNNGGGSVQEPTPEPEPEPVEQYHHDQEQVAFQLINEERAKLGKAPLTMAADLNDLAAVRAKELVNEYKTGTVHDGMQKYDPMYKLGEVAGVGDNMFRDANNQVNGWMNSPAHKSIIMSEFVDDTEIGISFFQQGNNSYWIAVLR